ncbi:MAG: hypothetical protein Fur0022_34200 [Anaerolineales bacterium]
MNPLLVTYAVLVGLTPLIPIPVIDDLVKGFFFRKLVQGLASAHHLTLTLEEIHALAEERSQGCVYGCLFGAFEFLVKRLLRKIIFILEWRRAIDLVTHTYYVGHLLDHAFGQGWYTPGKVEQAARLREAIEKTRAGANTNLVKRVVQDSFNQSKQKVLLAVQQLSDVLRDITFRRSRLWLRRTFAVRLRRRFPRVARWLYQQLRPSEADLDQVKRVEEAVAEKMEAEAPHFRASLGDLIARLQTNFTQLPQEHFEGLERQFAQNWSGNMP